MKYQLRTESTEGADYVVVETDGLKSATDYAKEYTRHRPMMHLRLFVGDRNVAVAIDGEFYMRVSDSAMLTAIAEMEEGGSHE